MIQKSLPHSLFHRRKSRLSHTAGRTRGNLRHPGNEQETCHRRHNLPPGYSQASKPQNNPISKFCESLQGFFRPSRPRVSASICGMPRKGPLRIFSPPGRRRVHNSPALVHGRGSGFLPSPPRCVPKQGACRAYALGWKRWKASLSREASAER